MLHLDEPTQAKIEHLIKQVGASKAAIIRHLIAQAQLEDFPKSWHMNAQDRRSQPSRH